MAASKYFRMRHDDELERVSRCPLCREMMGPIGVRSLLQELRISAPISMAIENGYPMASEIPDPAYPDGAKFPNFILIKTLEELQSEPQVQLPIVQSSPEANSDQEQVGEESALANGWSQLLLSAAEYAPEANAAHMSDKTDSDPFGWEHIPNASVAPSSDDTDSDTHGSDRAPEANAAGMSDGDSDSHGSEHEAIVEPVFNGFRRGFLL